MTFSTDTSRGASGLQGAVKEKLISSFCFGLFLYFLVDFFLHLSARVPAYGAIRPTLLLVFFISVSLFLQQDVIKGRGKNDAFKAILVLLSYSVISLPFVEWPGSVIKNNIPNFVKAIVFLFFTALIADTPSRLKKVVFVFIACQIIRVLEPLYLNITSGYWGSSTYLGGGEFTERLAGAPSDVINPNELGFVIVTAIPFLYYFLWQGSAKAKFLFVGLMPLVIYALILTMSRGAMIALLVIAFMIFKESNKKMMLLMVAILSVVTMWSVLTPVQKDRYLSLVDDDTKGAATVEGRWKGMAREFELSMQRPLVGHGIGTTPEAKFHYFGRRQAAHNLYAELIVEIGIIGALIFLWYIKSIYRTLKKNGEYLRTNAVNNEFYRRLNKSLIAMFWMFVVYSIHYWGLSNYYWYFFGGLTIAFCRLILKEIPDEIESKRKSLVTGRAGVVRP